MNDNLYIFFFLLESFSRKFYPKNYKKKKSLLIKFITKILKKEEHKHKSILLIAKK